MNAWKICKKGNDFHFTTRKDKKEEEGRRCPTGWTTNEDQQHFF
jgi:hypothetical protein